MSNNRGQITIENKKARYDYFVEDTIECGIVLYGCEVKSIRAGKASIKEAWIKVENGQVVLKQMHITPWETSGAFDIKKVHDKRDIVLLAHKREINQMQAKANIDGYSLIPLKVYFSNNGKCKVLVGICKGKKNYDKRASEKEKTMRREVERYR